MELADIERRAFLFALKAIYFDQGGILPSALDYYVAAGEALLSAAERGSKIPELKRKAGLYCDRAESIKRQLDDRAEGRILADDVGRDWDTLDVSADGCVDAVAIENNNPEDPSARSSDCEVATDAALSLGDELLQDYVVIYNSAADERRRSIDRRKFFQLFSCCRCDKERWRDDAADTRRLFESAFEADAAGNVEDAFLLYMRAVEETISLQKRDAESNRDGFEKTPEEKEADKKMRILASEAIGRIEALREEIARKATN